MNRVLYHRIWRKQNPEKQRLYSDRWKLKPGNLKKYNAGQRRRYAANKAHKQLQARQYRARMKLDPARLNKYRKHERERKANSCKNDLHFRITKRLRTRITMAVSRYGKSASCASLVGASVNRIRKYLESKWKWGMSWNNYGRGGWHIDHIIPCAAFDLTKPSHQMACFHYTNLQPMWEKENLRKGVYL